jgi:hypothetical protein
LETTRERVTHNVDERFPHLLEKFKTAKMIKRRTSAGNIFVSHDTAFFDLMGPSDFGAQFKG